MGILDGKVCVVTGGAGGLGLESAKLMLKEGAKVMLVDRDKELLTQAVKHALIGLMRTVAKEVASRNIRVNVLCPGPVDNAFQANVEISLSAAIGKNATEFLNGVIPLGRHARAEEIARMVLFLASDQSSFSTGSVFMADGGMNT